ncbi:MAG: hypothetical protein ACR2RF_29530 [Geminicoccaceae bacterium]
MVTASSGNSLSAVKPSSKPLDKANRALADVCVLHPADCGEFMQLGERGSLRIRGCSFLVDTGATQSTITASIAAKLDLPILERSCRTDCNRPLIVEASLITVAIGGPPGRDVLFQDRCKMLVSNGYRGPYVGRLGLDFLTERTFSFEMDQFRLF